jgi:hypothetical protein
MNADKKESKSYSYRRRQAPLACSRRRFAAIGCARQFAQSLGGFNPSLLSRSLRSSRLGESIPLFMRTSIKGFLAAC